MVDKKCESLREKQTEQERLSRSHGNRSRVITGTAESALTNTNQAHWVVHCRRIHFPSQQWQCGREGREKEES